MSPEETDAGQKTHHEDGRSPEQRRGAGSSFPVQGEGAASGALGQLTGGLSPAVSLDLSPPLYAAERALHSWTMLSDLALNLTWRRHQRGAGVHSAPWAMLAASGSQGGLPVA